MSVFSFGGSGTQKPVAGLKTLLGHKGRCFDLRSTTIPLTSSKDGDNGISPTNSSGSKANGCSSSSSSNINSSDSAVESKTNTYLISACEDGTARIWDAKTSRTITVLRHSRDASKPCEVLRACFLCFDSDAQTTNNGSYDSNISATEIPSGVNSSKGVTVCSVYISSS
jgi:WD40 repeat protein